MQILILYTVLFGSLTVLAWRRGWRYNAVVTTVICFLVSVILSLLGPGSAASFINFLVISGNVMILAFMIAKPPMAKTHRRIETEENGPENKNLKAEIERLNNELKDLKDSKENKAFS